MIKIKYLFYLSLVLNIHVTFAEDIVFADEQVKDICVRKWDTDGNGGLCLEEAAAVTSLGNAFKFKKDIISFDELKYFTGLTTINESAFFSCYALQNITLPNGITKVEARAFYDCNNLQQIKIPQSVKEIEEFAFDCCSNLTDLIIEEGLCKIGELAFANCTRLKSITLPKTVTSIENNAFQSCPNVEIIIVDEANPVFDSRNKCNAIVETISNTLFLGCQNTIIPESVTKIGKYAFRGCSNLSSIEIHNNVMSIDDLAFSQCTSLSSIVIPSSVTTIGLGAFSNCSSLNDVRLNEGLVSIEQSAFGSCFALKFITIPSTVTKIGISCFESCFDLEEVQVIFKTPLTIVDSTFPYRRYITLNVPAGCRDVFLNADIWREFKQIVEWFPMGDVNHDGSVNVLDVTLVIDYILDKKPENFHYEEANVNGDEYINVLDVTKIIDIILGK